MPKRKSSARENHFSHTFAELSGEQIEHYRTKLIYAIMTKNMKYVEELQPIDCRLQEDVEESLDFGIIPMNSHELATYRQYKSQPIGPFVNQHSSKRGYDVYTEQPLRR